MTFAKCIALSLLATAALPSAIASAADYEPPIVFDQAPEVPVEVGSGWYLRGDIGYTFATDSGGFGYRTFDPVSGEYGSADFDDGGLDDNQFSYGVGFGYHFNDLFRADFTADGMNSSFDGTTSSAGPCPGGPIGTSCRSEDSADMSAWSFMANGYVDLGTVSGFTPYLGAGLGYTYISWDGLDSKAYCVGATCDPVFVSETSNGGVKDWRFTWQAMAGVAYAINKNLKVDLGYRYRQIEGGDMFKWDAGSAAAGATGVQGHDGDLDQHEVRIGLRYDLW